MVVKQGDNIKVDYTGTLDDGTEFDSSQKHGTPLEFKVGEGKIIKGFDDAVRGMAKGEEKTIKLPPAEAYGDQNPMLVKKIPRSAMPADMDLKEGMLLGMTTPDGMQIPALVKHVSTEEVTLDLNHPLAGKTLNFRIKIVDIS